nr:replication protein A 70 kDa DNA-binding subunit B [Tanacetum cinerariifolium]
MATFVSGYICDLSAVKDNIKLHVRILRAWLHSLYINQQVKTIEMIVMDEHNTKMQATMQMDKLKRFQYHLKEGNALTIEIYSLDVVGQVIASEDLDNYDKNRKAKKPVTFTDDEIVLVPQFTMMKFWDVGTVIAIQEDEGWWYLGCRTCGGKVIKSTDSIDLESEMLKKVMGLMIGGAESALLGFRLQIRVQDETGTMSLSLFNDEVQAMIINSVLACATAIKDNEATSKTVLTITSLSQTNENTTPNEKQKTNKRPAKGEPGRESLSGKKKAVEIKVEKDA